MIKNKKIHRWLFEFFPLKYTQILEKEIENDFMQIRNSNPSPAELEKAIYDRDNNHREIFDCLNEHLAEKMILKAKKYGCPIPRMYNSDGTINTEAWTEHVYGYYYLNDKSLYELKQMVREDQKWKWDRFVQFTSLLFGLLGLIIGVLSQINFV